MAAILALIILLAGCAQASLLPPGGCTPSACNGLEGMDTPSNDTSYAASGQWTAKYKKRLAFIRSNFNPQLGTAPSTLSPDAWLNLRVTYALPASMGGGTPSLNYDWYDLGTAEFTDAPRRVPGLEPGINYAPDRSLRACCHACRVTENCPMYAFVPGGAGGTCYFVTSGPSEGDGPFDFTDGTDPTSARTKKLGSPASLTKEQQKSGRKNVDTVASENPNYQLMFLGGYCNPWKFSDGTVTDDPHFTGAHGTRFDFNGELNKAFCLITDSQITLNAVLKGYKSDNTYGATEGRDGKGIRSWIKELGLMWTDAKGKEHTFHLVARSGKSMARGDGFLSLAELDGAGVAVPQEDGQSLKAGDVTFTFLGSTRKKIYDMDRFQVVIGGKIDLSINMRAAHPKLQTPEDAEVHFNLKINDVKVTEKVHGVLGQTYRNTPSQIMKAVKYSELSKLLGGPVKADGESGAGFLEGSTEDYVSSTALKPDCKVSTYAV